MVHDHLVMVNGEYLVLHLLPDIIHAIGLGSLRKSM